MLQLIRDELLDAAVFSLAVSPHDLYLLILLCARLLQDLHGLRMMLELLDLLLRGNDELLSCLVEQDLRKGRNGEVCLRNGLLTEQQLTVLNLVLPR